MLGVPHRSEAVGWLRAYIAEQLPFWVLTVTLGSGQTSKVGGTFSVTTTSCWQLVEPFGLLAVQVMVVVPVGYGSFIFCPSLLVPVMVAGDPQAVAFGVLMLGLAVQPAPAEAVILLIGHWSKAIAELAAMTVMICWHVTVFPAASLAVHVRVVFPAGYGSAGVRASLRVGVPTLKVPQLSVPVGGLMLATIEHPLPALSSKAGTGHWSNAGGSASMTMTFCVQEAVFPCVSVAVQVTVVLPSG